MSMLNIGVLADGEAPSASQLQDAITTLNFLFDTWSTEKLFIASIAQDLFTLVGGQQTYQWGIGAPDFTTARPIYIVSAATRINGGSPSQIDIPLAIFNTDQWARISVKNTQSVFPTRVYPDFQFPYANMNFWPIPTTGSQVYINSYKPLTSLTTANATFALAPGFAEAVMYNLAVRLAPMYGKSAPQEILGLAQSTKAKLKTSLSKFQLMRTDDGLLPPDKVFNYLTGE
jgi:hypothetical protein